MFNADWTTFWGNPILPSVLTALAASVAVSLATPANTVTKAEVKAILDVERQAMEQDAAETVSAKPVMAK